MTRDTLQAVKQIYRLSPQERVERAARLLDEKRPGWYALIDLDHFSLRNPNQCVLAQVYRERRWWRRLLAFDDGFMRGIVALDVEGQGLHGVFAADEFYREHWITAILSRRAAAGTTPQAPGDALQALSLVGVGISE